MELILFANNQLSILALVGKVKVKLKVRLKVPLKNQLQLKGNLNRAVIQKSSYLLNIVKTGEKRAV